MARTWRSQMESFNDKKIILHEDRVKAWKEGGYGKRWLSDEPDAYDDPNELLVPPMLLHQ